MKLIMHKTIAFLMCISFMHGMDEWDFEEVFDSLADFLKALK